MATTDRLMTAEERWLLPDNGQRHELVAGELRTMAPSGGQLRPEARRLTPEQPGV
ncbi:MAG TPA: hypothetical protein VK066_24440 [Chloroflexota bacterium]|nr:hypothetical protein [Chloroflexota bacterium]